MIASAAVLLLLALASAMMGRFGIVHTDVLVGRIGDRDALLHRRRALRRGSLGALATAALLAIAGIMSLTTALVES